MMRIHTNCHRFFAFCFLVAGAGLSHAGDKTFSAADIEFFEKEIRPVIAVQCYECHSGATAKSGLQLDHRAGWLRGSDYRKVVDETNPGESILIKAVSHSSDRDIPAMPKDGTRLEEDTVTKLGLWIGRGMPWPKEAAPVVKDPAKHWSFQPVNSPEIPADAGHPVDYLIRQSQEKAGISPAPRADRATLYRRVHFDLLGLPPKFEEQEAFVNDPRDDGEAWSALLHHLMESPHYGERWARHWMDVARYADTKGYEAGGRERRFIYSYTYRDWLIRAFNDDLPYDQFLLYQLAAEQLVDWEGQDKHHLAAMGFLSLSKNGRQELVLDDRLDTTFRGTMALTVSCARCHDHKSDPISTKEYYGLHGIFMNSMTEHQPQIGEPGEGPEYEKYLEELAALRKIVDDFLKPKLAELAKEFPELANREAALIGKLERPDRNKLRDLERDVDKFIADSKMGPDKALVLADRETPSNQHVFVRGEPSRRGELAPRQFLAIASPGEPKEYEKGSGRLELAKDIVNPANPLTARNIVNRVWMWHFGEGIVRSVDDFGLMGDSPDHPELLDWLANWFVENGWSMKKLHHLILTSQTWQQQSSHSEEAANALVDAENRLLWKFNRRRLQLEQMRDGILDVSRNLDNSLYGHAVNILEPPYSNRRSVYAFIDRQNLNPVFRNFDFSNPQETTAKRPKTTIPMQALFTMNSDFVQDQAAILVSRTEGEEDRIAALHRAVFAREPSDSDRQLAESFLAAFESGMGEFANRQTDHEWSYGWGEIDDESADVTFHPFPHWTGSQWQMEKEWPVKEGPFRYLRAKGDGLHPGHSPKECLILEWRAPEDLRIGVESVARRAAVGKGNGVRLKVASSREGLLFDRVLEASQETMRVDLAEVEVKRGDKIHFLLDSHESNTSHDSTTWDPRIVDLDGHHSTWVLSEMFSGPATPATAWSAYAHALLNTNRFLFVD